MGTVMKYIQKECVHHGTTTFVRFVRPRKKGMVEGYRCVKCNAAYKARHRKRIRDTLLEDAGGKCSRCGYDRCTHALEFHHCDPSTKGFELSKLSTNLERARAEAAKCVLLCANCHAEEHAGMM